MKKFNITVWETRQFNCIIEANSEEEAKNLIEDCYVEYSTNDEFVSLEFRDIEEEK